MNWLMWKFINNSLILYFLSHCTQNILHNVTYMEHILLLYLFTQFCIDRSQDRLILTENTREICSNYLMIRIIRCVCLGQINLFSLTLCPLEVFKYGGVSTLPVFT